MPSELAAAICLVLVIEGLIRCGAPGAWKRMAERLQQIDERTLRKMGGIMVGIGLVALKLVH